MMLTDDTKQKNIKLWDLFQTGCSQFPLLFWGSVSKNLVSMKWRLADASTLRK